MNTVYYRGGLLYALDVPGAFSRYRQLLRFSYFSLSVTKVDESYEVVAVTRNTHSIVTALVMYFVFMVFADCCLGHWACLYFAVIGGIIALALRIISVPVTKGMVARLVQEFIQDNRVDMVPGAYFKL